MQKKSHMVWIDMEMTGLDPEKDVVIEIASLITDSELKVIAEGPNLVIHQPPKVLRSMDNWNKKHHKKSGLLDAVKESTLTVEAAQKQTLDFIKKYCLPETSPVCGNSIHQDRRFIVKYMPKINSYLHYRMVDVSTVKDLARRWYPKTYKAPKKKAGHRALADIHESVQELAYYRKNYFKRSLKEKSG